MQSNHVTNFTGTRVSKLSSYMYIKQSVFLYYFSSENRYCLNEQTENNSYISSTISD